MEILEVALGNVSLPVLALLFVLFLLGSVLYVIQDAVRDTLRLRRFAAFREAGEKGHDLFDDCPEDESLAASYVPPRNPREDLAYEEDSFIFTPGASQGQGGQSIVAYMLVLVFLLALVAVVVGIAISVVQSLGIETLGDGIRIFASL